MSAIDLPSYFGGGWERNGRIMRQCPGPLHTNGDRHPSLSIKLGDSGAWLLHCHVGCDVSDVLAAVGLTLSDCYPDDLKPSRGAGRSQHRLSATDALRIIRHEVTLCACVMGELLDGKEFTTEELQRCQEAVRRIHVVLGGFRGI